MPLAHRPWQRASPPRGRLRLAVRGTGRSPPCVRATLGAATDLHAPMGGCRAGRRRSTTSSRARRPAHARSRSCSDATNGSTRATLFAGYIPPGRAPWHYHLYDEIVWVLGRDRADSTSARRRRSLWAGIRVSAPPARGAHRRERGSSERRDGRSIGMFTPVGQPFCCISHAGRRSRGTPSPADARHRISSPSTTQDAAQRTMRLHALRCRVSRAPRRALRHPRQPAGARGGPCGTRA